MTRSDADDLLQIEDLNVEYATRSGPLRAVADVSLRIGRGEIVGLVGESGCGKSTLGRAILGLIDPPGTIVGGSIRFEGIDLLDLDEKELRRLRGTRIGMVFQDPMTSLVPIEKVRTQIRHTVQAHDRKASKADIDAAAAALATRLGIRPDRLKSYPHQLSGGMRQRLMIALALVLDADLVIADEPTTALDVIVEAQFLDLLRELKSELGISILLITHNIGVIAEIADRVVVMYAGHTVESGSVLQVFAEPRHPYTEALLKAVPSIDRDAADLYRLEGTPPNLLFPPPGCPFEPRCPHAMDVCEREMPPERRFDDGGAVACWLYEAGGTDDA